MLLLSHVVVAVAVAVAVLAVCVRLCDVGTHVCVCVCVCLHRLMVIVTAGCRLFVPVLHLMSCGWTRVP